MRETHIEALYRKHAALEKRLHDEMVHVGSNDLTIQRLKREKLLLRDEILRLTRVERRTG